MTTLPYSPKVGSAVETFRKVARIERNLAKAKRELNAAIDKIEHGEMVAYFEATDKIEKENE